MNYDEKMQKKVDKSNYVFYIGIRKLSEKSEGF